jgi:enoyl-[acyl-carrier protein] reductase I
VGPGDGILHAIAFAPADALGGRFLETPPDSAITAFRTSAFSLKALAVALADLYPERGANVVGLDFDASVACTPPAAKNGAPATRTIAYHCARWSL